MTPIILNSKIELRLAAYNGRISHAINYPPGTKHYYKCFPTGVVLKPVSRRFSFQGVCLVLRWIDPVVRYYFLIAVLLLGQCGIDLRRLTSRRQYISISLR